MSLLAVWFAWALPHAPTSCAQEPNTPPEEIFGLVRYQQTTLPDGVIEYTVQGPGVSFTMPREWEISHDTRYFLDRGWRGNGEGNLAADIPLHRRHSNQDIWLYFCVFRHAVLLTPDQIDKVLETYIDDKLSQRRRQEKLRDYRFRPSNYEKEEIGGHRALICIADYTEGKTRMVEYLVWVQSDKTLAEFSIRFPASKLDEVREQVEPIIQSLKIQ